MAGVYKRFVRNIILAAWIIFPNSSLYRAIYNMSKIFITHNAHPDLDITIKYTCYIQNEIEYQKNCVSYVFIYKGFTIIQNKYDNSLLEFLISICRSLIKVHNIFKACLKTDYQTEK
jgi:hypothetical protein